MNDLDQKLAGLVGLVGLIIKCCVFLWFVGLLLSPLAIFIR